MARKIFTGFMFVLFLAGVASAQEHFGIKVYPGAKTDKSTELLCKEFKKGTEQIMKTTLKNVIKTPLKTEAFCYRTGDDYKKVVEFFKTQKAVEAIKVDENPKSAMFCAPGMQCANAGEGLFVNIYTPWYPDNTGKALMKDVVIIIMQTKK